MMKILQSVILTSAALLFVGPAPAAGQSLDVNSSMGAQCIRQDCTKVAFHLFVEGITHVDVIRLSSDGPWQFATFLGVDDALERDVATFWTPTLTPTATEFVAVSRLLTPEPLTLSLMMQVVGTADQLYEGALTYSGQGVDANGNVVTFRGQVTPEPSTWILLATGLVGVALMARRRREDAPA